MAEVTATDGWEPKIVAIVCNWCTYAGADLAGISRIQYPPNVRIVRLPCTGRINPFYVMKALHEARTACVSGCHPGECHLTGNYSAEKVRHAEEVSFLHRQNPTGPSSRGAPHPGERFAKVIKRDGKVKAPGAAKKLVKTL